MVLEGEQLAEDVDLGALADAADGYSGSDLRQLCVAAAMRPVRDLLEAEGGGGKRGGKGGSRGGRRGDARAGGDEAGAAAAADAPEEAAAEAGRELAAPSSSSALSSGAPMQLGRLLADADSLAGEAAAAAEQRTSLRPICMAVRLSRTRAAVEAVGAEEGMQGARAPCRTHQLLPPARRTLTRQSRRWRPQSRPTAPRCRS